jgi:Flp pilus assembly protein TadB
MIGIRLVTVERLLQISLAALCSLSSILLGMGEGRAVLPVLATIVAIASVYLTDIKGWVRLNTLGSNIAGGIALVVAVLEFDRIDPDSQLLATANLLVYLHSVLLMRRKDTRQYWLLLLLSMLEVAVSSALNLKIFYGVMLVAYLFLGLATLTLFFLYREQRRYVSETPDVASAGLETHSSGARDDQTNENRWPLAGQTASFAAHSPAGISESGLNAPLAWHLFLFGGVSLVLASLLFVAMPRLGRSPWSPPGEEDARIHTIGFSQNVNLSEMDDIVEEAGDVLRLELYDAETKAPYSLVDEPLLRGTVLYQYSSGQWKHNYNSSAVGAGPREDELASTERLVRQKITVEPLDTNHLFGLAPVLPFRHNREIEWSFDGEQIFRKDHMRSRRFTYELVTAGLRDHRQSAMSPCLRRVARPELENLLQLPEDGPQGDPLAGLKALALQIVASAPANDPIARARALESHLRDSGQFQYSLHKVQRQSGIDPIEDFVTQHRAGHCEYYASALTLMLRSLKIPARLVVGFKGGELNSLGNFYQVRQRNAHAWVEVYLRAVELPNDDSVSRLARQHGAWLRLDGTPASDEDSGALGGTFAFTQLTDYAQYLWANYVMGMDSSRQQEVIYQPVTKLVVGSFNWLFDREAWKKAFSDAAARFSPLRWLAEQDAWLSWTVATLATVLLLVLIGMLALAVYLLLRRIAPRWFPWRRRQDQHDGRRGIQVEFYQRFERLLARQRLLRPASQTPREFAIVCGGQLAESTVTQGFASLPRRIVDAYYRVRFGNRPLDKHESEAVEQALAALEQGLCKPG